MLKINRRKYSVKGFTIAEVLITLVLTSLAVSLSYTTLSYVQKLFINYKHQNRFISEYTDFKERMDFEAIKAEYLVEKSENGFIFMRDGSQSTIEIKENVILLKKLSKCDTFHIKAKQIKKDYEPMKNPLWTNKLVRSLQFETEFSKQKFNFYFFKPHEASVKLEMDKQE